MKRTATLILTTLMLTASLQAHQLFVEDLLTLPHPFKVLKQDTWQERLSKEQKQAIQELRSKIGPRFLGKSGEAAPYKEKMTKGIYDYHQQFKVDEKEAAALSGLMTEMLQAKAEGYNTLKTILTEAQWEAFMDELLAQ